MTDPTPTILPEPPETLPASYRIEGDLAVRAVLRDLIERTALVTLYPDETGDMLCVSRLLHVDGAGLELDADIAAPQQSMLARASALMAVAFPGRVKTQFRLSGLQLDADGPDGRPVLRAALPPHLYRIQRRDAFRVHPPMGDGTVCVRRIAHGVEERYELTDLSAGGISVLVEDRQTVPQTGELWPHGRLETAAGEAIPCDLRVRHLEPGPRAGTQRVGLAFQALPSEVMRRIQLYVLDIERRLRQSA
ncbi:MAG: flagellar brake protein [Burkholderiaceae bacterium]